MYCMNESFSIKVYPKTFICKRFLNFILLLDIFGTCKAALKYLVHVVVLTQKLAVASRCQSNVMAS